MPRTLLLADDSVTIQKVVGLSFANEDVVLVTVSNGDDALHRARELHPDLVLADVVMPGRNGYEVCEAIKADPALCHIPVLLLTGTFEAFDQERARRAGADGHVTKPFEAQALVQQVKELMARPRLAPPPAFDAPAAATDTDPFLDEAFGEEPFQAEPLQLDAMAAAGELELATVAEEESPDDGLGAEVLAPFALAGPAADVFEVGQESFRGTPLFAPEPAPTRPEAVRVEAPFAAPPLPGFPAPAATAPLAPSFDATDTEATSPRAAAPAPASVLPEDDDFDLGFDDEPFAVAESLAPPSPPAPASAFGEDDPSGDTELDPGRAPGYDISFDTLDDPLAATRGSLAPSAVAEEPEPSLAEPPRPEGTTATVVSGVAVGTPPSGVTMDLSPVLRERLHDTLEKIAWEAFADLSDTIVRQAIERVEAIAWEVIPQLAEQLVREEIRRLKGE